MKKRKTKFSNEQKKTIIDMYCKNKYSIPEIIKNCTFIVSKQTIYTILKENNIELNRKTNIKYINLIGKTFGYLTVIRIEQTNKSGKSHSWRAICNCNNCGNIDIDVHPQSLLRGLTTSCGCKRDQYIKLTGINSKLYKGCGELNGKYWYLINNRAKNRNLSINITIEYAWNLFLKQNRCCAISKLPIKFAISNRKISETTASLDRIDSNFGYVEGNVQWVHKHINIMKNVFNQDYFISLCKLISINN